MVSKKDVIQRSPWLRLRVVEFVNFWQQAKNNWCWFENESSNKVISHLPHARAFNVMFILISGISSLDKTGNHTVIRKLLKVIKTNKPTACDTAMS